MGWKVDEVSCGFLFIVLALRGAGTGCLLTTLGRGGREKGESSGGQTRRHETDSKRADKSESRHGRKNGAKRFPELDVTEPGKKNRESERGCKTPQFQ